MLARAAVLLLLLGLLAPAAASAATPPEEAARWAARQRGTHEIGTTNCSPTIARWERAMGLRVPSSPPCRPWCGAFVHAAFRHAGIDLSARLIDPDKTFDDARAGQRGLRAIDRADVRPGDLLLFRLRASAPPSVRATHEAIVLSRPSGGSVRTAEGNVGHRVVVTRRGLRYAVLAVRVTRAPS